MVEDRWNVEHDTGKLGVPVIIVVEDNIRFYSSFLPVIYTALMNHSHRLIHQHGWHSHLDPDTGIFTIHRNGTTWRAVPPTTGLTPLVDNADRAPP